MIHKSVRPSMGTQDVMKVIVEALGKTCPKVNPSLSAPASSLAIALYKALGGLKRSELNRMLHRLTALSYADGPDKAALRLAKAIVTDVLDVENGGDDALPWQAAWRLWPLILTQREEDNMSKQATKKKTSKKTASKKTASKKQPAKSKGKAAAAKLSRPVSKTGKRGKVLAKFFGAKSRTPDKAAAELKTTRSNVLSHLHDLHKYHGIGYELNGGAVTILMPKGVKSPWAD